MRRRKNRLFTILFILILFLGLGYALLSQDLTINGITKVKGNNWDIHFDNVQINSNSVVLSTGDSAASINQTNDTLVEYMVTLNTPGDFYEFTVDVVNAGTVDGMIDTITSKLNNTVISTTNPLPDYLDYSVTYSDGIEIAPNHLLEANSTETYKIRVEFKRDIESSELPSTEQTNTFSFKVDYVQADDSAQMVPHPVSFADDDWSTIINAVQTGNTSAYQVGDTKTVELGNSLGTHTIRIANTSTPAECSTEGFSQTACGFVLEFADIITIHVMNSTATNVGGWPASAMRTYLNTETTGIYNSLPSEIKSGIIDTIVVSGHGSVDTTNYTTTDKLYLLSRREVWNYTGSYDTAQGQTRQLDYYANLGVTESNYSGAIKQRNGSNCAWWLRSANSDHTGTFNYVTSVGNWNPMPATTTSGVSPAFRIG